MENAVEKCTLLRKSMWILESRSQRSIFFNERESSAPVIYLGRLRQSKENTENVCDKVVQKRVGTSQRGGQTSILEKQRN